MHQPSISCAKKKSFRFVVSRKFVNLVAAAQKPQAKQLVPTLNRPFSVHSGQYRGMGRRLRR